MYTRITNNLHLFFYLSKFKFRFISRRKFPRQKKKSKNPKDAEDSTKVAMDHQEQKNSTFRSQGCSGKLA